MEGALDRSAWRPIHTRIALALGFGWALDSFEVQIVNSVITHRSPPSSASRTPRRSASTCRGSAGILVGALVFGFLADRLGRKRLFVVTLLRGPA